MSSCASRSKDIALTIDEIWQCEISWINTICWIKVNACTYYISIHILQCVTISCIRWSCIQCQCNITYSTIVWIPVTCCWVIYLNNWSNNKWRSIDISLSCCSNSFLSCCSCSLLYIKSVDTCWCIACDAWEYTCIAACMLIAVIENSCICCTTWRSHCRNNNTWISIVCNNCYIIIWHQETNHIICCCIICNRWWICKSREVIKWCCCAINSICCNFYTSSWINTI